VPRPARRRIDELALSYRAAKTRLHDIYVEGSNDKLLLDWCFRDAAPRIAVYNVDSIEVPDHEVARLNLSPGSARSRVLTLASVLSDRVETARLPLFIVDRDQVDLHPIRLNPPTLAVTDYGTLELGFISEESFNNLAHVACKNRLAGQQLMQRSLDISFRLGLIRAAAKRLEVPLRILDAADFIEAGGEVVRFDHARYLDRCANASNLIGRRDELREEVELCEAQFNQLQADRRLLVNDHDLHRVLRRIAKVIGGDNTRAPEQIRDLLLMASSPAMLSGSKLAQWISESFETK
jgi:hypothetical protein